MTLRRVGISLLAALLAMLSGRISAAEKSGKDVEIREQLGVMLQLDNMLPESHVWGHRARDVDEQFEILENAGVKWTRVAILWEEIEAKRGQWNWEAADKVVHSAKEHHLNILWIVGGTALWDSTDKDWDGAPKDIGDPHGAFPQFVQKLVERYKSEIQYWEVRNEPNLDKFPVETYAAYLEQAYHAIKREDPKAHVVLGGLGGKVPQELGYFKKLVNILKAKGGPMPFEIANFHVYPNQAAEEGFKGADAVGKFIDWSSMRIDKEIAELGLGTMPAWITEFDYPAEAKHQTDDPEFHAGEASQVNFVKAMFTRMAAGHPERKVFYASLLDDFNSGGEFKSTGLIESDKDHHILKHRESLAALRELFKRKD